MNPIAVRLGGIPPAPQAVDIGSGWMTVTAVAERWQIEVGWWRTDPERPVRRDCWRVLLQEGGCLDLRLDMETGCWKLERRWG